MVGVAKEIPRESLGTAAGQGCQYGDIKLPDLRPTRCDIAKEGRCHQQNVAQKKAPHSSLARRGLSFTFVVTAQHGRVVDSGLVPAIHVAT